MLPICFCFCCCLVTKPSPILCNPMNCITPGHPVHHQLLEFTQTHVHRVSDDIQPSHTLLSPFPPAPNPSLVAQWVKCLPTMWETQVRSLGREDPLEKEMATHSRESHGGRSLVGYSPWGHKESDTTKQLHFTSALGSKM